VGRGRPSAIRRAASRIASDPAGIVRLGANLYHKRLPRAAPKAHVHAETACSSRLQGIERGCRFGERP
jgi:hypothetical protein